MTGNHSTSKQINVRAQKVLICIKPSSHLFCFCRVATRSAYKMICMCVAMQRDVGIEIISILALQHAFTWISSRNATQAKRCELGLTMWHMNIDWFKKKHLIVAIAVNTLYHVTVTCFMLLIIWTLLVTIPIVQGAVTPIGPVLTCRLATRITMESNNQGSRKVTSKQSRVLCSHYQVIKSDQEWFSVIKVCSVYISARLYNMCVH